MKKLKPEKVRMCPRIPPATAHPSWCIPLQSVTYSTPYPPPPDECRAAQLLPEHFSFWISLLVKSSTPRLPIFKVA